MLSSSTDTQVDIDLTATVDPTRARRLATLLFSDSNLAATDALLVGSST